MKDSNTGVVLNDIGKDTWAHISVVRKGEDVSFYSDGALLETVPYLNDAALEIGTGGLVVG